MKSGVPLTDEDRWPWLRAIRDWLTGEARAGHCTVVTCSALRRAYRDVLREAPGEVTFGFLSGSRDLLAARLAGRRGHFMPASLLDSQLATLEGPGTDEAEAISREVSAHPAPFLVQMAQRRENIFCPSLAKRLQCRPPLGRFAFPLSGTETGQFFPGSGVVLRNLRPRPARECPAPRRDEAGAVLARVAVNQDRAGRRVQHRAEDSDDVVRRVVEVRPVEVGVRPGGSRRLVHGPHPPRQQRQVEVFGASQKRW